MAHSLQAHRLGATGEEVLGTAEPIPTQQKRRSAANHMELRGQLAEHHASEDQKTKLVGGDLLEQLLMTTAPPAKRYMSMIMRGLCHKSACPV